MKLVTFSSRPHLSEVSSLQTQELDILCFLQVRTPHAPMPALTLARAVRESLLLASPHPVPCAEGIKLRGRRGDAAGGRLSLHRFPGPRELPIGRNGTSRTRPQHGRRENKLGFATQAWLVLKGFSSAWLWRGVSQSWLFSEMEALGPVLGWGREAREGTKVCQTKCQLSPKSRACLKELPGRIGGLLG